MLPTWLSHPSVVSSNIKADRVRVKDMPGLDEQMIQLLRINGIKKLFPGEGRNCKKFIQFVFSFQKLIRPRLWLQSCLQQLVLLT
jgi:hypothetical protein